jgi:mannose-6-phosphate isomerase-like protein (cupin superfamily)
MFSVKEFMDSGVLELYVLGIASEQECKDVEKMISIHPEIVAEIEKIKASLQTYAVNYAIEPNAVIKPFLMATIDFTERLKNGEPPANPPMLTATSTINDYSQWLGRPDMVSADKEDVFAKIIGYTPQAITAIVWLKSYAPHEVHDNEYERFLIVEGTCDIIVEDEVNQLVAGDYFAIPLHKKHMVKVTSAVTCKVILQRVAA